MCQRAKCPDCQRPTFKGCGRHIEQVLGDVPPAERCQCHAKKEAKAPEKPSGLLRRLFGG